jgi:hypothetical protein
MTKFAKPGAWQIPLVASVLSSCYIGAQAQSVIPPPLPPGSNMVQKHVGMHPEEVKRSQRAHHHSHHHKKDVTRDDTLDEAAPKPDTPVKPKTK